EATVFDGLGAAEPLDGLSWLVDDGGSGDGGTWADPEAQGAPKAPEGPAGRGGAMLTSWGMSNCSSVNRRDPWLSNLSSMSLFTWIRSAMMCSNSPIRFTIMASVVLCCGACGGGNVVVVVVSVVVALNC
nr:hypothetical protein [Tanacetum cinerariifolium]